MSELALKPGMHPADCPLPKEFEGRMEIVIQLVEKGLPANQACASAGVRWKDYQYVAKHHEEWMDRVNKAKAECVAHHLNRIADAGNTQRKTRFIYNKDGDLINRVVEEVPGDWKANSWMLERTDRENFGQVQTQVNVNLEVSAMIKDTAARIASRGATIDITDAEYEEIKDENE